MESLLEWSRGPCFIFAFTFMVLGLLRHMGLTLIEIVRNMRRAGDKHLPYSQIIRSTLNWLFPVEKIKNQFLFSLTSILFHIAILIVPIFLGGHIALWTRGLGLTWPAISNGLADVLTILAIITAVALVIQRLSARATRSLSRFQDYIMPLIIAIPFVSGFLMMHPSLNPFGYDATFLVHIMSANLILIMIPLTKLSHIALLPSVQLVSEVAWHWPATSGSKVGLSLGKENEAV